MSRVSYQVPLHTSPPPAGFRALDPGAIGTRAKDGTVRFTLDISKRQARWLRSTAGAGGKALDAAAVVRAAIDIVMELEVDWAGIERGADLRAAVRDAVLVRRPGG